MTTIEFVTAEQASCAIVKQYQNLQGLSKYSVNLLRGHVQHRHCLVSSLPCPAEPYSVASFPIDIKSGSSVLNPKAVANLWLQLLAIQVHNGNFIRYDEVSEALKESPTAKTNEADDSVYHANFTTKVCLTQMSSNDCALVEAMAQKCDPPLDPAVIELICILPYASIKSEDFKIVPDTIMVRKPNVLNDAKLDRALFSYGPTIPPQMMQLTEWWGGDSGIALFIDTRTGDGVILNEYEPRSGGAEETHGVRCRKFDGLKRPIEELLKEWINNFLTMKWIYYGGTNIVDEGVRSIDFLKQRRLLQEYNWPSAFPLPQNQFQEFLKRKAALENQSFQNQETGRRLSNKWYHLSDSWYQIARDKTPDIKFDKNLRLLDQNIQECLKYHEMQQREYEFAKEANVLIEQQFWKSGKLHTSGGGELHITPDKIMERFSKVLKASTDGPDEITNEIQEVLDRAYELSQSPNNENYFPVQGSDDDSSSDYVPSEDNCWEKEEFESDDDAEILGSTILAALTADMAMDIAVFEAHGVLELSC